MDVQVRKETYDDVVHIYDTVKLSFGREQESKLVNTLRQTNCLSLSLVASIDGKIVGHVAFSPVHITGSTVHFEVERLHKLHKLRKTIWIRINIIILVKQAVENDSNCPLLGLAPLAVLPEYQRRGIGSKLVIEGLNELRNRNVKAVFVLGSNAYYSRFGFVPSYSRFAIKSEYDVDDKNFMALELFDNCLDKISGNLTYCSAFRHL